MPSRHTPLILWCPKQASLTRKVVCPTDLALLECDGDDQLDLLMKCKQDCHTCKGPGEQAHIFKELLTRKYWTFVTPLQVLHNKLTSSKRCWQECFDTSIQVSRASSLLAGQGHFLKRLLTRMSCHICTGLAEQGYFLKRLLSRFDVKPVVVRSDKYKSAMDAFTETRFTKADREATHGFLTNCVQQIVQDVAISRRLPIEKVRPISLQWSTWAGTQAMHNRQRLMTLHKMWRTDDSF